MIVYTPISKDDLLNNHLRTIKLRNLDEFLLYKGMADEAPLSDYYFFNPTLSIRPSKTTASNGNIYNLLLNNLPTWKANYPLRERSIITSTCQNTASGFAEGAYAGVYVTVPLQEHKVVIAPASDIWYSFKNALLSLNPALNISLKQFNHCIIELAQTLKLVNIDKDWGNLIDGLTKISDHKHRAFRHNSSTSRLIQYALRENKNSILIFLDEIFSPQTNEFVYLDYRSITSPSQYPNNEVWSDATCCFIEINRYKELLTE